MQWILAYCARAVLVKVGTVFWLSCFGVWATGWCNLEPLTRPWEFAAATWLEVLFLLLAGFLFVDGLKLGDFAFGRWVPSIRG